MRKISATLKRPNIFTEHVILWGHESRLYRTYRYTNSSVIYNSNNLVCISLLYENHDEHSGVFTFDMYSVIISTEANTL